MSLSLEKSAASSVAESMRSKELTDFIASNDDVVEVNAVIESGGLDGIPVLGMLSALRKAGKDIGHEIYVRKIVNFLTGLDSTTQQERTAFTERLESDGELEHFGETILLIIEKSEDTVKPKIIGRIMSAHIKGYIGYKEAMRLASLINRCYTGDLEYLRSFREGYQSDVPVADALFSAGFLEYKGGSSSSGRRPYALNEYGKMLVEYGWSPNKTTLETFEKTDREEDLTRFESIDDLLKDLVIHE
ncbi:MAG: hypothetical protein HQK88_14920 [Nitrospirae bacterium]|nr:hypothetical protein [Nitrospirota bacterium]MBF0618092.1 hypothetical protein [Nitrospirota bacterium]